MVTRSSVAKFDAGSMRRDPVTGDLHVVVRPTRAGIFLYRNPDGSIRRELRSREEVFKADFIDELNFKPYTNLHPVEGGKKILLSPKTALKYRKGFVHNHRVDEDNLHTIADLVVTDPRQIELIERGLRGVSCAYHCDEDLTPGVDPEFGPYDLKQVNLRDHNHLAGVPRGRAGPGAEIRMDEADDDPHARFDAEEIDPDDLPDSPEPPIKTDSDEQEIQPMASIRIDEDDYEIPKELEKPLKRKLKADEQAIKDLDEKAKAEGIRADQAEGEIVTLKSRLDSYEQAEAQQARKALEAEAAKHVKNAKFDGLSDRAVKEQVITAKLAISKFDSYGDSHIEGMYAAALAVKPAGNRVLDALDGAPNKSRHDEADPITAAYNKQIAAMSGEKE